MATINPVPRPAYVYDETSGTWIQIVGLQGESGPTGPQGIQGITGPQGSQASSNIPTFSRQGPLSVSTGTLRFYVESAVTIGTIRASVGSAPVGSSLILDVNKNGITIYGTQANRLSITSGNNTSTNGIPTVTSLAAGDFLTIDIDQVGSTTAGSDLTVIITLVQ